MPPPLLLLLLLLLSLLLCGNCSDSNSGDSGSSSGCDSVSGRGDGEESCSASSEGSNGLVDETSRWLWSMERASEFGPTWQRPGNNSALSTVARLQLGQTATEGRAARAQRFMQACVEPSEQGRRLQASIGALLRRENRSAVYMIHDALYVLEHLVPLMCAMPGPLISVLGHLPSDGQLGRALQHYGLDLLHIRMSAPEIEALVRSGRFLLVSCSGNAPMMRDRFNHLPGVAVLNHGVDNDELRNWWHHNLKQRSAADR